MSESKPTLEEDIERVLERIEVARGGYRPTFSLRPDLARRMHNISEQYVPQEIHVVDQETPLTERIKAIYPVIHRTYDVFVEMELICVELCGQSFGEEQFKLDIYASQKVSNSPPDYSFDINLWCGENLLYSIVRWGMAWKRTNVDSYRRNIEKRRFWDRPSTDECVDISSAHFRIYCSPLKEFVYQLMAVTSELELRQATLDHLLSLPDILGKYLDKKEKGRI